MQSQGLKWQEDRPRPVISSKRLVINSLQGHQPPQAAIASLKPLAMSRSTKNSAPVMEQTMCGIWLMPCHSHPKYGTIVGMLIDSCWSLFLFYKTEWSSPHRTDISFPSGSWIDTEIMMQWDDMSRPWNCKVRGVTERYECSKFRGSPVCSKEINEKTYMGIVK